jgi:hypothetical protein
MRPLPLHSNSPYLSGRGSDIEDDDSEEEDVLMKAEIDTRRDGKYLNNR